MTNVFQAQDSFITVRHVERFSLHSREDELLILEEGSRYTNPPQRFFFSDELLDPPQQSIIDRPDWFTDPRYVVHMPKGAVINGITALSQHNIVYHDLAVSAGRHILPRFIQTTDDHRTAHIPFSSEVTDYRTAAMLFFDPASGMHHSHWLLQTLPKVQAIRDAGIEPDCWIVLDTIRDYQIKTLEALGIHKHKLLIARRGEAIRFQHLYAVYTSNDLYPTTQIYDELLHIVPFPEKGPERVYVSRLDARNPRRFLNEDAIIEVAKRQSFEIIIPSQLTFEDEIRLFRDAKIIAGPIGAGIYNCLFTKPGACLMLMSDANYVMDWPQQIASLRGHTIGHLLGNGFLSAEPVHNGKHNAWVLDPALFEEAIMLVSSQIS